MKLNRFLASLLLLTASACADSATAPGTHEPLRLVVQTGDRQTGLADRNLRVPVVVRAVDAAGVPVSGARVRFQPEEASGAVEPVTATTDRSGYAVARWRLGPAATRNQRLSVTMVDDPAMAVVLEATALRPEEGDLVVIRGALGPLRSVLLAQRYAGGVHVLDHVAIEDTVVRFAPIDFDDVDIIVLSTANRPLLQSAEWTAGIDTVDVTLLPPVPVDFLFTVRTGDFDEVAQGISQQMEAMHDIWARAGAGIVTREVRIVDATADGGNLDVLTDGLCTRTVASTTIQVTYVRTVGLGSYGGYACLTGNVFMAVGPSSRYPNLLAHELGHVFSLEHEPGVMNAQNPGTYLSDGQVFQMHFDERSALNTMFHAQPEHLRRWCSARNDLCLRGDYQ